MKRAVALALATLVFACAPANPEAESYNESEIIAALETLRSDFEAAVASGDMAKLSSIVSRETIMVQPGSSDWRAMQEQAAGAPFAPGARIEISPIELKVINAEWAYEFGASRITYPNAATGEEIELRDTYLILLRNDGAGWKPFREVASANPPPGGWPQDKE